MAKISPLSVVDPKAQLADDVEVGPFCVVGPDVQIDSGTKLLSHVVITGNTRVGRDNVFHPHCVIGSTPQDKKYKGAPTRLDIGNGNQIREAVTINIGTEKGGGITKLGNNNLLMVNVHLGHDAQFGSNCILANNTMIAGHVICGDGVNLAGGVGVHHFVTIGDYAYIGGYARIRHDVPPFVIVDGADKIRGLNVVGLERAGYTQADISALDTACRRLFYSEVSFSAALAELDGADKLNPQVRRMVEFLRRRDSGRHGRYLESLRGK